KQLRELRRLRALLGNAGSLPYCGGVGGVGAVPGAGGVAPGGVGSVGVAVEASFSVIMPIVQPGELSRMRSRPFIARKYFALSSASKKITGGPWVASFALAARYQILRRSIALSSVSVSAFTWNTPASSTLKRICRRSAGGGSTGWVWSGSSGT